MNYVTEETVDCPYCGETIGLLIDHSVPQQNYIEDCQVCCRPIKLDVTVDPGGSIQILAMNENE
ncbi:MAG: CPXCG motif-containing cysteine-rich protein [Gammaproteobacteria bacterium]|nr:CPXCG motif-containing cysteine-rich protein [Gammaproteobacteria bacterium]